MLSSVMVGSRDPASRGEGLLAGPLIHPLRTVRGLCGAVQAHHKEMSKENG
jgi:hypothetical protein